MHFSCLVKSMCRVAKEWPQCYNRILSGQIHNRHLLFNRVGEMVRFICMEGNWRDMPMIPAALGDAVRLMRILALAFSQKESF